MTTTDHSLTRTTLDALATDGVALVTGTSTAAAEALPPLPFATGLATVAHHLPRPLFGLGTQLLVPPGTWAVVFLPDGTQRCYTPGNYRLWNVGAGTISVQWLDARRQQVPLGPIEGWSADKWRVRFWLLLEIEVGDPLVVAMQREPLSALVAAARAAMLHFIEQHTHAALTGSDGDEGGMDAPARMVADRLRNDPALHGLRIISVRVLERHGDERQIEAATAATVAAAQIFEESRVAAAHHQAQLQALEAQATVAEREHRLRLAATEATAREQLLAQQAAVQHAALGARLDIVLAQIGAQTAEIAREEQVWQAEQRRLQGEWERVQQQLRDAHGTDQQVRLLEVQQTGNAADLAALADAHTRSQTHALALAEVQARMEAQRTAQAEAMTERRAQHEQALLELHLRHEQLVGEQMQRLEHWRTEQVQISVQSQRQHDKQLAVIAGTAQVAAAAAAPPPHLIGDHSSSQDVAATGLHTLQMLAD